MLAVTEIAWFILGLLVDYLVYKMSKISEKKLLKRKVIKLLLLSKTHRYLFYYHTSQRQPANSHTWNQAIFGIFN